MNDTTSEYLLGSTDEEIDRLAYQHEVWSDETFALWQDAAIGYGDLLEDLHVAAQQLSSIEAVLARFGLGMVAVALADPETAQKQYALLLPVGLIGFVPWSRGCMTASRVLALLTHTMGKLDKAEEHFEDALAYCRKGFRPELAGPVVITPKCYWIAMARATARRPYYF